MLRRKLLTSLALIAVLYGIVGLLWIYGSDALLGALEPYVSRRSMAQMQTGKGMAYVLATAALLYWVLNRMGRRILAGESNFRLLFNLSPVAKIVAGLPDGRIVEANRASLAFFGMTRDQLSNLPVSSLFPNHAHPELLEQVAQDTEEIFDWGVWPYTDSTGLTSYSHVFASRLTFLGQPSTQINLIDLTTQMQAEQEAMRQHERLLVVRENMSDAYFVLNRDWTIRSVNGMFETLTGMRREQIISRDMWELFPGSKDRAFYPAYQRVIEHQEPVTFEEFYPPWDRWFSLTAYPTPEGVAIFFRDITLRKREQEEMAEGRRLLDAIINATDDRIWYLDRHMRVVTSNHAYQQGLDAVYGEDEEAKSRHRASGLSTQAYRDRMQVEYERAFAGERRRFSVEAVLIDGLRRDYEVTLNPIDGPDGQVIGLACVSHDITNRVEHQRRILAQNERLKQIAWFQSHEVRGPVASILGLMQLYDRSQSGCAENQEIMEHMESVTHKLDRVIRSIVTEATAEVEMEE